MCQVNIGQVKLDRGSSLLMVKFKLGAFYTSYNGCTNQKMWVVDNQGQADIYNGKTAHGTYMPFMIVSSKEIK